MLSNQSDIKRCNSNDCNKIKENADDTKYDFFLDSSLPYYLLVSAYLIFYLGVYLHNQFLLILFVYAVLPYMDRIFSLDLLNPTKEKEKMLKKVFWFKFPLYLACCLDYSTFIYGIYHITDPNYSLFYKFTCMFVLMTFQGVSINYSHELCHKVEKFDNFLAVLLLIKNYYLHWIIEHNYGHHRWVGTPRDPATAKKGENVYEFIPKSLIGSFISSWNIEKEMVKENGRSLLTNRIYFSLVIYGIYTILLFKFFGVKLSLAAMLIGISGPLYLEVVNYLEHYGLKRDLLANGEYEPVTIHHSWNTPHRITNYFLFKLQRHSDHHANALKPYQVLCSYDDSPNLPSGYAFCILLALIPNSWFNIIDPMVESYSKLKRIPDEVKKESDEKTSRFLFSATIVISALTMFQFIINFIF